MSGALPYSAGVFGLLAGGNHSLCVLVLRSVAAQQPTIGERVCATAVRGD
jgi:hypothetical protein